jgi:hypothetical protein
MLARALAACAVLVATSPAASLPVPPPPPEQLKPEQEFLRALPKRLPVANLDAFSPYVAPDLKVYHAGELVHSSRQEWFDFLQSFAGKSPEGPQGVTISREGFFQTFDGDIVVLEFKWPIAPKGKEGQISYHQSYDLQMVSYRLQGGVLTRVEYGKPMRRYDQWMTEEALGSSRSQ